MHKLISVSYLGMLLMTWIDHGAQLTMDYFRYSVSYLAMILEIMWIIFIV